jgi:hypothetical protein
LRIYLKPGGVVVKHRGLWSPRREFESLPGYFCPGVNSYFFQLDSHGFASPRADFLRNKLYIKLQHLYNVSHYIIFEANVLEKSLALELNSKLLKTLLKNHKSWEKDRELTKIVNKMERGKNLQKNEFSRVYWMIWKRGH